MKGIKKLTGLLLAITFTLSFIACSNKVEKKEESEGIKITDSYNREITLDKIPERVITLSPGATETIFALGKQNALIARSDYDDYPSEVSKIPSVGSLNQPNIEKIAELKPDLVIGGAHFPKEAIQKFDELGIKVAVLYGSEDFEGAYENIIDIARVLGVKEKGQEIVDGMKKKVSEVEGKVKGLSKPRLYYVIGFGREDFTAGGNTFINQLIEKAGGENIAKDVQGWKYSFEKIVEKNPEFIVVPDKYDTKKGFLATDKYKDLPAVKNGNVFAIDNNMLDRQGPRQSGGLEELAKILHPEAFK